MLGCIQKYDPQAGTPGDQEDSDGGVHWYVGVVPTQATKLYE